MELFDTIQKDLKERGFTIIQQDLDRPWGGFYRIDESQASKFIEVFYSESDNIELNPDQVVAPKILVVKPDSRLSWQYHHRRSEIWKVVQGEAYVGRSDTDEEGTVEKHLVGSVIHLKQGERHRLIAKEGWVVIAEIWKHSDSKNLSDENDIVRLQDDYGR